MRQPRFTYLGAFHHCMNRGHNSEAILAGNDYKRTFLDLLAKKAIWEFEKKFKVKVDNLETGHREGKRPRAELLVRLRDLSGLTYRRISEFSIFSNLHYKSLIQLYLNAHKRLDVK